MKVIGYGICGPGEAKRYLRQTLEEFKRLCDEVVILCNNTDKAEHDMIDEYGFKRISDRREWGKFQWRIKQDFLERDISRIAEKDDMIVCLDMDEVLDPKLTKEWLLSAELDAYHVFIVDLWNDPEHFKPESCFWNVRIFRWNGETQFKVKPVHCGLAPEWAYHYHRHAPFFLLHYGLMLPEDRERKIARYQKYDPHAEHLDKRYYDMLKSNAARPFDPEALHEQIAKEVAAYKQSKPRDPMKKPKERFGYIKNPHGEVLDIPERHVQMTLKRPGFEWIGWADEQDADIDDLFDEDDNNVPVFNEAPQGSYQRSTADEKAELEERNAKDDIEIDESDLDRVFDEDEGSVTLTNENVGEIIGDAADRLRGDNPKPDPNAKKVENKTTPKKKAPAKKAAAKKSAKK